MKDFLFFVVAMAKELYQDSIPWIGAIAITLILVWILSMAI
jgi:hypothetical protein